MSSLEQLAIAHLFEGHPPTVFESIKRSWQRHSAIKDWACAYPFLLSNHKDDFEDYEFIERRTKGRILTLLVPALLALNNRSCADTIALAWKIIRKKWGKSVKVYMGFGDLIFYILLGLALSLMLVLGIFLNDLPPFAFTQSSLFFSALLFILFLIAEAINNTITTILHVALLFYAEDKHTGPFDKKLLHNLL